MICILVQHLVNCIRKVSVNLQVFFFNQNNIYFFLLCTSTCKWFVIQVPDDCWIYSCFVKCASCLQNIDILTQSRWKIFRKNQQWLFEMDEPVQIQFVFSFNCFIRVSCALLLLSFPFMLLYRY